MATIDLPALQTHFEEQLQLVLDAVNGAANHRRFIGFSDEEISNIIAQGEIYEQWRLVLDVLLTALTKLAALGYPVMPTMSVPPSMMASLAREATENAAFQSTFVATPIATTLGAKVFGVPIPKE